MSKKIELNKKFYDDGDDYPDIQQFRIYDPNEEKFHYSGGTPSMISFFFDYTAALHTYYKMPYQRATGLYDEEDNMVYEGDLLKHPKAHHNSYWWVKWGQETCRFYCTATNHWLPRGDGKKRPARIALKRKTAKNHKIAGDIYKDKYLIESSML